MNLFDKKTKDLIMTMAFSEIMNDPITRKFMGANLLQDDKSGNDIMGAALLLGNQPPTFVNDRFINRRF